MVERMLCMYEAPGSIPGISTVFPFSFYCKSDGGRLSRKDTPFGESSADLRPWAQSQMPGPRPLGAGFSSLAGSLGTCIFKRSTPSYSCCQVV